jgi:hypothetical protein
MRPALAALAEQQQLIENLRRQAHILNKASVKQEGQITSLARGLQTLAALAGVDRHVAAAMLGRKVADIQNPAQPVPEPPAQPSPQGTEDAKTPEAFADVTAPGLAPGTTNDVAADATTTAYTPGMDIGAPAFKNLIDVTAPVEGTQNPRPLEETKTLTDVRVGNPMNPQVAFPLRGDFANAQRTSSARTYACLRLARLQIAAGLVEGQTDIEIATGLEKNAELSLNSIEAEIGTLERVRTAARRQGSAASRRLVPRTAAQRSAPSLQAVASHQVAASVGDSDEDLFL